MKIKIHYSIFLVLLILVGPPLLASNTTLLGMNLMLFIISYSSILAHEYGHAYAGKKYGLTYNQIELNYLGGATYFDEHKPLKSYQMADISFAGPKVNLLIGTAAFVIISLLEMFKITIPNFWIDNFIYQIYLTNIIIGIFNLLPVEPLDGSNILQSFLTMFKVPNTFAVKIRKYVSLAIGCSLILFALVTKELILLLIACGLTFFSYIKYSGFRVEK